MQRLPRPAHARKLAYDALALAPARLVDWLEHARDVPPRPVLRRLGECAAKLRALPASAQREADLAELRRALPRLCEWADDRRDAVRAFALFALVRLDPLADWPARWHTPTTTFDRVNWLLALGETPRPDAPHAIRAALADPDSDAVVRATAALVLADQRGTLDPAVEQIAATLADCLHPQSSPLRALARRLPPWRSLDPWPRLRALGPAGLEAALPRLLRLAAWTPEPHGTPTLAQRLVALALPRQSAPANPAGWSPAQRRLVAACLANGRLWTADSSCRIAWEQFGLPTDRLELRLLLGQASAPGELDASEPPRSASEPPRSASDSPRSASDPPRSASELQWLLQRQGMKNLRKLRWLDASGVADDQLCAELRQAVHLQRLRLRESAVTDAGLAHLSGHPRLELLDLSGSPITDAGLAHLAALPALRIVRLGNCRVSGAGLAHLAGKRSVRVVQVSHPAFTDADLLVLARLPRLWLVDVQGCSITAEGRRQLLAARPRLRFG